MNRLITAFAALVALGASGARGEVLLKEDFDDGKLACDIEGLPLRDEKHAAIRFNRWMLGPYFHGGSHKAQCNYMDALVVSTEYVGTLEQKGNQPPRSRFTSSREWGSMTARFDASKSADPEGEAIAYAWDFGDGKKGSGRGPSHEYAADGKLVLDLWEKGGEGQAPVGRLEAGSKYPVRIEHRKSKVDRKAKHQDHEWRCILFWQSASTKKEPVPTGQFYPPEDFVAP